MSSFDICTFGTLVVLSESRSMPDQSEETITHSNLIPETYPSVFCIKILYTHFNQYVALLSKNPIIAKCINLIRLEVFDIIEDVLLAFAQCSCSNARRKCPCLGYFETFFTASEFDRQKKTIVDLSGNFSDSNGEQTNYP